MLRGKRLVVTGGAGFVGSHLVERLAERNEVVVLDDFSSGSLQNLAHVPARVKVVRGSILDGRAVRKAFKDADVVFHLAALTSVPESLKDPLRYAEANVMGTLNVLTSAREAGADRVVFASTCAIYGRAAGPLHEDLPPDPVSPYAVTKLACEHFCRSLSGGGTAAVALRLFNVYGPRQSSGSSYAGVVARFVRAARDGKSLTLYGDGRQTRDFVYAADVAEAFERAATVRGAAGGVFNVGSGTKTSILDLIGALEAAVGHDLKVLKEPARAGDIRRSRADTANTRKALGWEATTPLREGLRRILETGP